MQEFHKVDASKIDYEIEMVRRILCKMNGWNEKDHELRGQTIIACPKQIG
ncbi:MULTISPECIES: hypothetical protein [Cytobacillus]|nr:hypothetical protein [Cytobacillus firmus]